MRKIKILLLSIVLYSCSTTKKSGPCSDCPAFSYESVPIVDTIYFPPIHHHYLDENYCVYVPEVTYIDHDTIYVEN